MKKLIYSIIFIFLSFLMLGSCSLEDTKKSEVLTKEQIEKLITFEGMTIEYDGNSHELFYVADLPKEYSIYLIGTPNKEPGSYLYVLNIYYGDDVVFTKEAYLIIEKHETILTAEEIATMITFEDREIEYDREEHELVYSSTLPEGYEISVTGDKGKEVGTYQFTLKVSKDGKELYTKTSTLTIKERQTQDEVLTSDEIAAKITFNDLEVTYDGAEHEISYTSTLPEGYTVSVTGSIGKEVGTYPFTLKVTHNGSELYTKTATLTIKAESQGGEGQGETEDDYDVVTPYIEG